MTTGKTQECPICSSTEDVATRDCLVCGKALAALCNRCHMGFWWQTMRGWLDRAKALMDRHGCRKQPCNRRHDRLYDCHSEECYAYPATIERESTKLRAMGKGLDGLSWGLMWALDEHDREGQREYHRKIDELTASVEEQENYLRELQDQEAESDGT